jgi:hypothetical protein
VTVEIVHGTRDVTREIGHGIGILSAKLARRQAIPLRRRLRKLSAPSPFR